MKKIAAVICYSIALLSQLIKFKIIEESIISLYHDQTIQNVSLDSKIKMQEMIDTVQEYANIITIISIIIGIIFTIWHLYSIHKEKRRTPYEVNN